VYKYKIMSQTQLGRLFGVTSHVVGRWLVEIGLRTSKGRPSTAAHQGGYCEISPCHGNGYHWVWNVEKTVPALEQAGHRRMSPPPLDLVEPPSLVGPFEARECEDGRIEVVSSDGNVGVIVVGERNAKTVLNLLNLANRYGKLGERAAQEPSKAIA